MTTTIVVWVLIIDLYSGRPVVVDNIATHAECIGLAQQVNRDFGPQASRIGSQCYPVRKVVRP